MKIIGITGGIGSGKSTVAGFLTELGAVVVDTDEVGHEILESDDEARRQIMDTFGQDVAFPDGGIDRRRLGDIVFGNPEALSRLNGIVHPRITRAVEARLKQYREQGVAVVVIEAPLLVEVGWHEKVDLVWVTTAPEAVILERLEKSGMSRTEAMARIGAQLPDKERAKHADALIDTDCSLDELKSKVEKLWRQI